MISIAIVEDDSQIASAVGKYLSQQIGMTCIGTFTSAEEFLQFLETNTPPSVVILDLGLPGMSGIDCMRRLKQIAPDVDIIVFSVQQEPQVIFQALCCGASAYLLKNERLEKIVEAIMILGSGGSLMSPSIARKIVDYFQSKEVKRRVSKPISPREFEIIQGLTDGLSYKLIADRMKISIETVRFHIKSIYKKLHVHSRSEVIIKSLRGEL